MYKTIQATIQPSLYSICSRFYNCFSFLKKIYLAMVTILDFQLTQTLPNMYKTIQETIQPSLYSICLRFYNFFLKKKIYISGYGDHLGFSINTNNTKYVQVDTRNNPAKIVFNLFKILQFYFIFFFFFLNISGYGDHLGFSINTNTTKYVQVHTRNNPAKFVFNLFKILQLFFFFFKYIWLW